MMRATMSYVCSTVLVVWVLSGSCGACLSWGLPLFVLISMSRISHANRGPWPYAVHALCAGCRRGLVGRATWCCCVYSILERLGIVLVLVQLPCYRYRYLRLQCIPTATQLQSTATLSLHTDCGNYGSYGALFFFSVLCYTYSLQLQSTGNAYSAIAIPALLLHLYPLLFSYTVHPRYTLYLYLSL